MYNSKLVVAVKHNGNVLRENGETIKMPYGAEYSLYIKNLNTEKALVTISIDGNDICNGGLVVYANKSIDIERFIKNNDSGNRFKFIERTADVEAGRGIGVEDGLIRVEFQFERPPQPSIQRGSHYIGYRTNYPPDVWTNGIDPTTKYYQTIAGTTGTNKGGILRGTSFNVNSTDTIATTQSIDQFSAEPTNDAGITVEGSISDQKFQTVADFPLEDKKHVMILKLVGVHNDKPVEMVTPARQKPKCVTCKRVNKATASFCSACGTSLIIV